MCAAPLGNRFAAGLKNSGRPLDWTPEEMRDEALAYFEMETNKAGVCKPTISGLAFHLGMSVKVLKDYRKREEFSTTLNILWSFVESCYEKNLHGYNFGGSIFVLKNLNSDFWKDEHTTNQNHSGEVNIKANFGNTLTTDKE